MNENSYLNPADIRAQCDAAISSLEEDNRAIGIIEKNIMDFGAEPLLRGQAFENLRQQILDYLTVLMAMKRANQKDIDDFRFLKLMAMGQELNGSIIIEQKDIAMSAKKSDLANAEKYSKKASKEKSLSLRVQYTTKVSSYMAMAALDQRLYDEWKKKEETYDAIDKLTSGLFEEGASIRATAVNALSGIQGAYQNGVYAPDMNASWRNQLIGLFNVQVRAQNMAYWANRVIEQKTEIDKELQAQLVEMGYTQEEIHMLCIHGISLTYNDIRNLKSTIGTEKIYRSEDAKALLYNGKVYYIYVPNDREPCYDSRSWKTDWKKELTKTDFDLAAGILGISLEEIPKEEIYSNNSPHRVQGSIVSGDNTNATMAGVLHLLMGVESFMVSALEHTEITMVFESDNANRRVTIGVGDSESRLRFQEIDYDMPINTYRSETGYMGEKFASDYAKGIYQVITGESVPDEDATYTITGTLDEGHRECNMSGYLFYSETGELLYTPLVLPGDTAYVSKCMMYEGLFPKEILNFTDLLSNPVSADEDVRKIFEESLEGN